MMLSAKIAMRSTAPPANMLNMPRMPEDWALKDLRERRRVDAGDGDVGAEPVDHQRRQREPDPLLELFGLGERAEIEIGGKLLGGGNHCSFSLGPRPRQRPCVCPARLPPTWDRDARCASAAAAFPDAAKPPAVRPWPAIARASPRVGVLFLARGRLRLAGLGFLGGRSSCAWPRRPAAPSCTISVIEPPALSIAAFAPAVAWLTVSASLAFSSPLAQDAHAVERAADDARGHQRGDVHRLGRIEQPGVHGRLQAAEIDLVEDLAVELVEAALGQAPMQRHLAAFEAAEAHAGARRLALAAAAALLPMPEPMPRPMRTRILRDPGLSLSSLRRICNSLLLPLWRSQAFRRPPARDGGSCGSCRARPAYPPACAGGASC